MVLAYAVNAVSCSRWGLHCGLASGGEICGPFLFLQPTFILLSCACTWFLASLRLKGVRERRRGRRVKMPNLIDTLTRCVIFSRTTHVSDDYYIPGFFCGFFRDSNLGKVLLAVPLTWEKKPYFPRTWCSYLTSFLLKSHGHFG